jgi:NADH-quinone oxidoreductase E subunit
MTENSSLDFFEFNQENLKKIETIIAKYPAGKQKSAVMPLLDLAQRQNNNSYINKGAVSQIAKMLSITEREVYEVATFYSMYNKKPVGKYLVQICGTTPCMLRGSEDIISAICKFLGIELDQTTEDGLFTLMEVECLGACSNAPMIQINDLYYEDLTPESVIVILQDLKNGKTPKKGSQTGRNSAEPK